jgi:hypothetical protein
MVALAGGTLLTAGLLAVAGSASPATAAPGTGPTAVVALGDSAISGEGAGAYEPGTNGPGGDFCHRSTRALIQQTAIPGIQSRISLACSGARPAPTCGSTAPRSTQSRRRPTGCAPWRGTTT